MSIDEHDPELEQIVAALAAAGGALPEPPSLPVARTACRELVAALQEASTVLGN